MYAIQEYSSMSERWYTICVAESYGHAYTELLHLVKKNGNIYRIRNMRFCTMDGCM